MDDTKGTQPRRRSGRRNRTTKPESPVTKGYTPPTAGQFKPLSDNDLERVHSASLEILDQIGISEAPPVVIDTIQARGGTVTAEGRLLFPKALVTEALGKFQRGFQLFGRAAGQNLDMTGARVHAGSGGASPNIVDTLDGSYRTSTLSDLYDAARIVDTLDHIQFFSRPMIAGDMENNRVLDVNTAFASLAGTSKHVMVIET